MIFCDYLDVTHASDSPAIAEVRLLLSSVGGRPRPGSGLTAWSVGDGVFKFDMRSGFGGFTRFSASGSVCAHLRSSGVWGEYLSLLGSEPHNVTRLDAALDSQYDPALVLAELTGRFPSGRAHLAGGRKSYPIKRLVGVYEDLRGDRLETGTFYIGHGANNKVSARVYDKGLQLYEKKGAPVYEKITRIEVTARREYGATLRDAYEPERLFWSIASPTISAKPSSVPDWVSGWGEGWQAPERVSRLPYEVMCHYLDNSPDLEYLVSLADHLGADGGDTPDGRLVLARKLLAKIGVEVRGPACSLALTGRSLGGDT